MPSREDIVLLASYNVSMNEKLYAAAATLPQEALIADRGAFFGSILGTLNHIVAGDTIWLRRFTAHPSSLLALKDMAGIPVPSSLADRYSDDLLALLEHRRRLDSIIVALATELRDSDLEAPLLYKNSRGEFQKSFGSLLLHLFNHQTHHRGQVTTLLSQSGVDIGITDLVNWIPDYE
ncbi:MAG: DinB family protein [Pseudomonadota bacterium]